MPDKRMPERRCAGCMQSFSKASLIRVTAGPQGLIIGDTSAPGRGVYLCKRPECALLAEKKNAIARGLKTAVSRSEMNRLKDTIYEISQKKEDHGGDVYAK